MTTAETPDNHFSQASTALPLESQFTLSQFKAIAEKASKDQLLLLYTQLLESYLVQREYYKSLLQTSWSIGTDVSDRRPTTEESTSNDPYSETDPW